MIDFLSIPGYDKESFQGTCVIWKLHQAKIEIITMAEQMYYTPDIYTPVDEEDNEQAFELLDVMELENDRYFALILYFESPEDSLEDDGNLVILKSQMVDDEEMMTMNTSAWATCF